MLKRLCAISALFVLAGCGSGKSGTTPGTKLADSQTCFSCHATNVSPGTGAIIIDEWKASVHNTRDGAGCADCHEPLNHPNNYCSTCHGGGQTLGTADEIQRNPDKTGKCLKCHQGVTPLNTALSDFGYHTASNPERDSAVSGIPVDTERAHFNNSGGSKYPASYVSSKYLYKKGVAEGNCRKCHNPHNPTSQIQYNRDWARSGHGATDARGGISEIWRNVRAEVDFKTAGSLTLSAQDALSDDTRGYQVCVRCHTTTGYINYVKSGFSSITPFAGPGYPVIALDDYLAVNPGADISNVSPDKSKELTNCNTCHDNGADIAYNFKLRKVGPVTTHYNWLDANATMTEPITKFGVKFPDYKESNMCVTCHSGRLIGLNIKMADARGLDLTQAAAKKIVPHFRSAASTMTQVSAFEFYTDPAMYSSDIYSHKYIGIGVNPAFASGDFIIDGLKADPRGYGPCIGCHMNSDGSDSLSNTPSTSHTFMPVNRDAADLYTNDPSANKITRIVAKTKSCDKCHTPGSPHEWTPTSLQAWKDDYKAGVAAFMEIAFFALDKNNTARTIDDEGRPAFRSISNWTSSNANLQDWLKFGATEYAGNSDFIDPLKNITYKVHKAAYTLGAVWNFFVVYFDPGAYAHNNTYIKRMIFDSIDWLDDGILNSSVASTVKNGIIGGDATHPGTTEVLNIRTLLDTKYGPGTWDKAYRYLLTDGGEDIGEGRP